MGIAAAASGIGGAIAAGGIGTAAAISAGGALAGAGISAISANSAADKQAAAANNAANVSLQEANNSNALIQQIYGENKDLLSPFVGAGTSALTQLQNLTGTNAGGNPLTATLTKPFADTPGAQASALVQTPGYKFALDQGLLATQAGSSAQGQGSAVAGVGSSQTPGVGPSGPMGKALANYATGLASTTYQQQFSNYLTQNQQIYNQIAGQVGTGLSAGSAIAGVGTTAGGQSANALLTGAGQYGSLTTAGAAASAAGTVGAGNAIAGGLTNAANAPLYYNILSGGNKSSLLDSYTSPTTGLNMASNGLVGGNGGV